MTPGPWKWTNEKGDLVLKGKDGAIILSFGSFPYSCECHRIDDDGDDMRLIAAAPELLAYIEWHLYDLKHDFDSGNRHHFITELVAKIRGEK